MDVLSSVLKAVERLYSDYRFSKITVEWLSDEQLLAINQKHLNHDYYTDIITFDYSRARVISGEMFISEDRIRDNASRLGTSENSERIRVVAHGVLHLLGYGDKTDEEKVVMRAKEDEVIKLVEDDA